MLDGHNDLSELYAAMAEKERADERAKADAEARLLEKYTVMLGHNGPPKDTPASKKKPLGLGAAWVKFANQRELKKLAKLHARIERKEQSLRDLRKDRSTIMTRCIRRMRRSKGLN